MELAMTLAVGIILAALAVPAVRSAIQYFRVHHGAIERVELRYDDHDDSADKMV